MLAALVLAKLQRRTRYKISCFYTKGPLDLRIPGPFEANIASGAVKSTLPGPQEGSSILNVDLVVVAAAVSVAK